MCIRDSGPAVRIFEGERASGRLRDAIAALVDIGVVQRAEQRQIGQAGLAAVGPVPQVVALEEQTVDRSRGSGRCDRVAARRA